MCNTRAAVNWQLQRDRFAFLFWLCPPRSRFTPFLPLLPLSPSTLTKHMWQAAASSLDISVSYVPNRLYSYLGCVSLKLSASIRRWFFAFAGLTPIHAPHRPHVPPGNYGKQNKNSIFSALLQVFRSKLCPKNK